MQQISCTEVDQFRKLKAYMIDRGFDVKSNEVLAELIMSILDLNQEQLEEAIIFNNTCNEVLDDQCNIALARFEISDRIKADMLDTLQSNRGSMLQYMRANMYRRPIQQPMIMTKPSANQSFGEFMDLMFQEENNDTSS